MSEPKRQATVPCGFCSGNGCEACNGFGYMRNGPPVYTVTKRPGVGETVDQYIYTLEHKVELMEIYQATLQREVNMLDREVARLRNDDAIMERRKAFDYLQREYEDAKQRIAEFELGKRYALIICDACHWGACSGHLADEAVERYGKEINRLSDILEHPAARVWKT